MTTDQRKPFAPSRMGRYELRNGEIATVCEIGSWGVSGFCEGKAMYWSQTGFHCTNRHFNIVGLAPDDREFCLARARELTQAHGFAVVPMEAVERCQQWFNACQDLHPAYLENADYVLAKQFYEILQMRVPSDVEDAAAAATGEGK